MGEHSSSNPGILLLRLVRMLYLEPLNEDIIEFDGLSRGQRILAQIGYGAVAFLLVAVLLLEIFRPALAVTTFLATDKLVDVPVLAVLAACLAFCLGWAFTLTGATDARKRVFLPIWALFGLQIFMVMPLGSTFGMVMWCLGGPFVIFGLGGVYVLSRKWQGWKDWPLAEFAAWFGLFGLFFFGFAFASPQFERFAHDLAGMFGLLAFFSVPFWLFSGATVVDLALTLAAKTSIGLRKRLAPGGLTALALGYTLARPGIVVVLLGLLYFLAPNWHFLVQVLVVDLGLALLFALVLPIFGMVRGLTTRFATLALTLCLAAPVFALSLILSLDSTEIEAIELTLGLFAGLMPLLVFVFIISHTVLSIGADFANGDGRIIPRSGRIGLMFGFTLLVIAFTIFMVNLRYVGTGEPANTMQDLTDSLFTVGAFALGLPYLLWKVWKHPDELAGAEKDFPPEAESPAPRRQTTLLAGLAGLVFTLSSCGLIFALDQALK